MAEDVAGLMEHLGIKRAHVISKSMGGMIAQMLAGKYPEKVHSLVLACTLIRHDSYGEELLNLGRIVAEKAGLYETYRLAFLLSYSKEYCMRNRSRLDEAERLLQKIGSQELLHGYLEQSLACERHDSRSVIHQIQAPTLILAATGDMITTADNARELSEAIPGSQLVVLDHGMHGFWREFPEEINPIVAEFLARHPL
jgi:pimeloyl-ACP methyl ester carboxylesterase